MALTGLQIFKLLPKTNCKKCGKPTCLAFAMSLAQKKANLDECPDASEETRASLAEASAPPIKAVQFGTGDNQVKVRGYRVEIGEVESALRRVEGITEAVVVARSDAVGATQLIGYYSGQGAEPPSAADIRAEMSAQLPDYMIPSILDVPEHLTSVALVSSEADAELHGVGEMTIPAVAPAIANAVSYPIPEFAPVTRHRLPDRSTSRSSASKVRL